MATTRPGSAAPDVLARRLLERHGIRPTTQRLRVAEILLTAPRHMTAEQILVSLRSADGHVSKATVYNTLNLFVAQGLAREIHADPERCVYDSTMSPAAAGNRDCGRRCRDPGAPQGLNFTTRGRVRILRAPCRSSSAGRAAHS